MGESKRRKSEMGALYGNPDKESIFRGVPITKEQGRSIYKFMITGTWICIGALAVLWGVVRLGLAMKWWGAS